MSPIELSSEQLQAVAHALPDPVFILTESGRYAEIIGGSCRTEYHDPHPLRNRLLTDVMEPERAAWFLKQIRLTLEKGDLHTVEYGLSAEDLKVFSGSKAPLGTLWFEGRIQPLASGYLGEPAVIWVARNITRRYELEMKLRTLCEQDELTGIYNRRKILAELLNRYKEFKRYFTPTCLLIIDFDHFKFINDKFGHLSGDEVICKVVSICQSQLRDSDLIARLGGEEFAVLLPYTELDEAVRLAERLRKKVNTSPYNFLSEPWPVSISIGAAQFALNDEKKEDIIARADKALYQAKEAGRNCVRAYSFKT